jgi:hypothetical protein
MIAHVLQSVYQGTVSAGLQPCHTDGDDSAGLQPLRASAAEAGNRLSTNGTAEAVALIHRAQEFKTLGTVPRRPKGASRTPVSRRLHDGSRNRKRRYYIRAAQRRMTDGKKLILSGGALEQLASAGFEVR